ncbi:distal membrane-arm assembly complex protein 2 [Cylas formicarius]|uniref:distal membrane-arm assembly complex protein 2 n=1 Tax=Cylas formicarius TaxID=197179 RepID=UPI002958D43B|nr:distal membrane-arm assembly complex protein 2 [Cylas formicarius]
MLKVIRKFGKHKTLVENCRCFSKKTPGEQNEQTEEKTLTSKKKYGVNPVTKDDLQWRTPWHEKEGAQLTMLRAIYSEHNNREIMQTLQQPINLSPSAIKKWWMEKKDYSGRFMQQYIPERHRILGTELAAAHFLLYRGGAVKFHGQKEWLKGDDNEYFNLPRHYTDNMYLEGIDCEDVNLYYEGLVNFRGLKKLQWLSLNGCKDMDDFCMDIISNIFSHSLLYLDLRNCLNISERGIGALYKMRSLKILYLDDLLKDTRYELTCLLLQEANPALDIRSDVINFEIK